MRTFRRLLHLPLAASILLPGVATADDGVAAYEATPALDAAEQLGGRTTGPHFTIDPSVTNDGRMNHYWVQSEFQRIEAYGNSLVLERAHEQEAIAALREIKQSRGYMDGAKAASKAPLALTRHALTDPVSVARDLPQGLSNWWNDLSNAATGQGKDHDAERTKTEQVKDLLGYARVKRRLAAELGVDPFSSNELLQTELDDVAWVAFAGGLTIDLAMSQAPAAARLGVKAARQVHGARAPAWHIPEPTLLAASGEALTRMGLWSDEADGLVYHPVCTPTHRTGIVSALADLPDVAGRADLARLAATANDEAACRSYLEIAELVWSYHHRMRPVLVTKVTGDVVTLEDASGQTVLPVRADYWVWTAEAEALVDALPDSGAGAVWLSGQASERTRQALAARGVTLHEGVLGAGFDGPDVAEVLVPDRAEMPVDDDRNQTVEMLGDMRRGTSKWMDSLGGRLRGNEELPPVGAKE